MDMRIEYRPPSLSYNRFYEVEVQCFPDEPLGPEEFAGVLARDFWAAYDSESLVGYSYLICKPEVTWLARLGVATSHRKRGIATRLLETMIAYCRSNGPADMMLYTQSTNRPALRLYERFDFKPIDGAYQFVLSDPQERLSTEEGRIQAIPVVEIPRPEWPPLPREWGDLAETHSPPKRYVLLFRDRGGKTLGYCRLDPGFPGCFPLVLERPLENLASALEALHPYLRPEKDILKLTFSSDELADACRALGLGLNYNLVKMLRPGDVPLNRCVGSGPSD
ncbi:MAG: GNAT family N-acetyltransferase [Bradymonadales bacterium]|nr:GNAT family N-acetyltransferase [Bradymonadales bacterium]